MYEKKFGPEKNLQSPYNNYIKSPTFNACIVAIVTYGAQTWTLTKKEEKKIVSNKTI